MKCIYKDLVSKAAMHKYRVFAIKELGEHQAESPLDAANQALKKFTGCLVEEFNVLMAEITNCDCSYCVAKALKEAKKEHEGEQKH